MLCSSLTKSSAGSDSKRGVSATCAGHPDITALGKVIGGGLPVGAYGARSEIMEQLSPLGPVYQAGTLSGNPLAMAAGAKTLDLLDDEAYEYMERLGALLEERLGAVLENTGIR